LLRSGSRLRILGFRSGLVILGLVRSLVLGLRVLLVAGALGVDLLGRGRVPPLLWLRMLRLRRRLVNLGLAYLVVRGRSRVRSGSWSGHRLGLVVLRGRLLRSFGPVGDVSLSLVVAVAVAAAIAAAVGFLAAFVVLRSGRIVGLLGLVVRSRRSRGLGRRGLRLRLRVVARILSAVGLLGSRGIDRVRGLLLVRRLRVHVIAWLLSALRLGRRRRRRRGRRRRSRLVLLRRPLAFLLLTTTMAATALVFALIIAVVALLALPVIIVAVIIGFIIRGVLMAGRVLLSIGRNMLASLLGRDALLG